MMEPAWNPCPIHRSQQMPCRECRIQEDSVTTSESWEPIAPGQPVTAPVIAVPEGFDGTEAEAVGLAVAGAMAGATQERDRYRAMTEEAVRHLGAVLSVFPETSWAGPEMEREKAVEASNRLAKALWPPDPQEPGPTT